jgi:hypothetical protein
MWRFLLVLLVAGCGGEAAEEYRDPDPCVRAYDHFYMQGCTQVVGSDGVHDTLGTLSGLIRTCHSLLDGYYAGRGCADLYLQELACMETLTWECEPCTEESDALKSCSAAAGP